MKLGDFGIFVIFAAIYAAGTLGLPPISFMSYQLRIGEIPSAFVALFGMPAVFGLTLGQFIANIGLESKPLAFLSPMVSFVGLLIIYYSRKRSTLGGCIAYIVMTAAWLSILLPILKPEISSSEATITAFIEQAMAVMIGYVAYLVAKKSVAKPAQTVGTQ